MERLKTKDVLQRVEVNSTPPSPIGSVSVRTSPDVTPGGDHMPVLILNRLKTLMRNVKLFASIGIKINP